LAARDTVPAGDFHGRMMTIGFAYRQWALGNPQRYQLIFGTPIPGYVPPFEKIMPAGARSLVPLVGMVETMRQAGRLRVRADNFPQVSPAHKPEFEAWLAPSGGANPLSVAVAMLIWSRVHGLVSLEIGHQLPPFGPSGDALYRYELESIARQFFNEA